MNNEEFDEVMSKRLWNEVQKHDDLRHKKYLNMQGHNLDLSLLPFQTISGQSLGILE